MEHRTFSGERLHAIDYRQALSDCRFRYSRGVDNRSDELLIRSAFRLSP